MEPEKDKNPTTMELEVCLLGLMIICQVSFIVPMHTVNHSKILKNLYLFYIWNSVQRGYGVYFNTRMFLTMRCGKCAKLSTAQRRITLR